MIVKKHVTGGRLLLAVCDSSIAGQKFSEGEKELDLSSNFFNGTEHETEDVKSLMKSSYIVNLVGEESLQTAKELIAIKNENVILVEGVPHAQLLFVPSEG